MAARRFPGRIGTTRVRPCRVAEVMFPLLSGRARRQAPRRVTPKRPAPDLERIWARPSSTRAGTRSTHEAASLYLRSLDLTAVQCPDHGDATLAPPGATLSARFGHSECV